MNLNSAIIVALVVAICLLELQSDEKTRRIARETTCRTLVEAGLVKSCEVVGLK